MKILIACEFTGTVRDAFIEHGHDVISCDILPTEKLGKHYQGDILDILNDGWDMMIGHPPCTYLCNSGVTWLHTKSGRWELLNEGREFFLKLLNANIERICIENPIPHKYANLPKYNQIIQPWQFGHGETKATCFWLKNLPKLKPTNIVSGREQRISNLFLSCKREDLGKERSRTFQGIADAMAEQWGTKELPIQKHITDLL